MIRIAVVCVPVSAVLACANCEAQTLDAQKYQECRVNIPVDYKNLENDYAAAKPYEGVELVLVRIKGKNKINSIERGYLKTYERDGKRGTFFQPTGSVNAPRTVAKFPVLNDKQLFCYRAECFDSKK